MKVKEFLKSKTLKCILVLLCIALISGAVLSICNDLLKVTDDEKALRTIESIYGKSMEYEEISTSFSLDKGVIDKVYKLSDGNYLIKATGNGGYQNGTVTVWAVAEFNDGEYTKIRDVNIESYEKQTLMSNFTQSELSKFDDITDGDYNIVVSGATKSSKALNNAVNTIKTFVIEKLSNSSGRTE